MMHPGSTWFPCLATLLPLAVWSSAFPTADTYWTAAMLLVALLAVCDLGVQWMLPCRFDLELPGRVHGFKNHSKQIPVLLRVTSIFGRRIRLGIPFAPDLHPAARIQELRLAPGKNTLTLEFTLQPLARGETLLDRVFTEERSLLGFWKLRRRHAVQCAIRVFPDLLQPERQWAAFFRHRSQSGVHLVRQIGKGREFEKLREYLPGDSFDDIHWKATAKRATPVTKEFQIEKTQEIYCVLDTSRLMAQKEGPLDGCDSILERAIIAALTLGRILERQGDLFGVITFHNRVHRLIKAGKGNAHYLACRDALFQLKAEPVNPDFKECFSTLKLHLRRRALLFFFTELDEPLIAEEFIRHCGLIAKQHLLEVLMVRARGITPLFEGPSPEALSEAYEQLGGHMLWRRLQDLKRCLHARGVSFQLTEADTIIRNLIQRYLLIKRRQIL